MRVAAKTVWQSLQQKQYIENIWQRIVHQNSIYNSPLDILQIYAQFQSYIQKVNLFVKTTGYGTAMITQTLH